MGGVDEAVRARLLELCQEQKVSVNRMCELSAVPQPTVNNFLNHKTHNLGIITLKKLADGLDITISDFFDTEIFRNPEQEIH